MELRTYELLLLHAINPKNGNIYFKASTSLNYGLAGAVMYELMREGLIEIENNELTVLNEPSDNEVFSNAMQVLKSISKKSIQKNTRKLAGNFTETKNSIIEILKQEGIIALTTKSYFGILKVDGYKILNNNPLNSSKDQLYNIIYKNLKGSNDQIMLLNLIEACTLSGSVFKSVHERKAFRKWIKSSK